MPGVTEWAFLGGTGALTTGNRVTLRNEKQDDSIRFGERDNGIELVWDNASDLENITLHSATGASGQVRFGEAVGIEVDGGGFLYYAERDTGINLEWSNSVVAEWEVTGGSIGEDIRIGQRVGLLNIAHGDHLVYGVRSEGINLRWYSDIRFANLQPFGGYPPIPMPNRFRAPGREAAQILVAGEARQVTVFHGQWDDELDWHVFVSLDPRDRRDLTQHLRRHARGAGGLTERELDQLYCELMVLDASNTPFIGDDQFFSADLRTTLALPRAAWDYSETAIDQQGGDAVDATGDSRLTREGARVYLQGCFVNDADHGFTPELHPLDSIAYALDEEGRPLRIGADHPDWPATLVTWRVGVFTNSTTHRIGSADYLRMERRTTWFLDLPGRVRGGRASVERTYPGFFNRGRGAEDVESRRPTDEDRYDHYDRITDTWSVAADPRDGALRLKVEVRMDDPDQWGGMFLAEYTIQPRGPLDDREISDAPVLVNRRRRG